jgi:DNA polymerase I-like protein with 3'-5' exonuclease and polymerase domains
MLDSFQKQADEHDYVETMFGFRRPIVEGDRSSFSGNQAVNSPIQGGAHQLVLMAVALLKRKEDVFNYLRRMRMEVHDNLCWSLKLKRLMEGFQQAKRVMEKDVLDVVKNDFGIKWKVPLVMESDAGFRLGSMTGLKKDMNMETFVNKWCLKSEFRDRDVRKELESVAA